MSATRVVAIDGAAGSGKSTLAAGLARELGLPYVNTGLMYRALAAAAIRSGASVEDQGALVELMQGLRFTLTGSAVRSLEVEGYAAEELTSPEVEATVSTIARHPAVRELMRLTQRALGEEGAVMEGRDIGSMVFPDAAVKLYLVAPEGERADRRAEERSSEDERVAGALRDRDRADAATNPFVPPEGATVLDTGMLGIDATLRTALATVRVQAPWLVAEASP
jgi:cytidylate kinase